MDNLNTYENMIWQIKQKTSLPYCIESFGADGDFKIHISREKRPLEKRKVLFIGTGRCGTTTIAKLFQANGKDVGHEIDGKDGISSHWFAYDSDWHPYVVGQPLGHIHLGEHRSDYDFEHVFQIVRNPLDCISSIQHFFHDSDCEFLKDQNISSMHRGDLFSAMRIYLLVNQHCQKQTKNRYRIEELNQYFSQMYTTLYGQPDFELQTIEPANRSQHPVVTWDKLHETNGLLAYHLA